MSHAKKKTKNKAKQKTETKLFSRVHVLLNQQNSEFMICLFPDGSMLKTWPFCRILMHLGKHMLVRIKMQICCSLFWTRVGRSSEVLFLLALLLSAEVGVAPRLLQPADFADDFFFFPFLLVLNLRGSYLYGVRLVPLGTPPRQGPSQQNISSPWFRQQDRCADGGPWGAPGLGSRLWNCEHLTCTASHRLLSAPMRPASL